MVTLWAPTVIVPERAAPVFAATENFTVPFPLPLAPDVMEIHESAVVAVQVQPADAVTVRSVPAPAVAASDSLVGLAPPEPPPAWLMVTFWPPIEIVPERGGPGFAVKV